MVLLASACEKSVDIDLPDVTNRLAVEGKIEEGQPPYVILTTTSPYFGPTDISTVESSFVRDAEVQVLHKGTAYPLEPICSDNLTPELRKAIARVTGQFPEDLENFNFCVYLPPIDQLIAGNSIIGQSQSSYELSIEWQGNQYTASTYIPETQPFDSVWFKIEQYEQFGYIRALLTDPDTIGNKYRFFAQRINTDSLGQPLDATFIADIGSLIDDIYFNGQQFEFLFRRGFPPGVVEEESTDFTEPRFFAEFDTVVFKLCAIDQKTFEYVNAVERQFFSNGNPFSAPADAPSNISGGAVGIWAGYGVHQDTLICVE